MGDDRAGIGKVEAASRVNVSGSGTATAHYVHGPWTDEPATLLRAEGHYAYHGDALGSVRRLTDAGQNTARTYRYDASASDRIPYLFPLRIPWPPRNAEVA